MINTIDQNSASEKTATPSRNPFFAVFRGETLQQAINRHQRDHGMGRLLLLRDFNGVLTCERPVKRAA